MPGESQPDRWRILAVLSIVQFMLFLDDTVVTIALPSIDKDLGFSSPASLAWVVNAYVLMYGGLLLLGGRLADLLGRRRIFLTGLVVFAGGSLANALAFSPASLIASRGIQGIGSAMVAPSALSIVVSTFSDARERAKAVAFWNALAGAGGTAGVILSGVITDLVDWRLIFYINLPVAIAAFTFVLRQVPSHRRPSVAGNFDLLGALLGTAATVLFVYTLLETHRYGWLAGRSIAGYLGAAALLAGFVLVERSSSNPLIRLGFFSSRRRNWALAVQFLLAAVLFGVFFLGTLYMQQVLGYSPMRAGLSFLGFFVGIFIGFATGTQLMLRVGVRIVIVAGLLTAAVGLFLLTGITADSTYFAELLPGMLIFGIGIGWGFVPVAVSVMADADESESGLAAGLINTGQQIGGALGIAVLVALAETRTTELIEAGSTPVSAQIMGTQLAWTVSGVLCVVAAVLTVFLIGGFRPGQPESKVER